MTAIMLSHSDIMDLNVPFDDCIACVEEVLKAHARKQVHLKPKLSIYAKPWCFYTSMPAGVPDLNIFGLKLITRFPRSSLRPAITGTMLLYELESGVLLGIMDATWLTAVRTGIVAALSVKHLAVDNCSAIGLIGLGNTATAFLIALQTVMPKLRKVKLLKYKDSQQRIIERFSNDEFDFEVCGSCQDLFESCDVIVSSLTIAGTPFVRPEWIRPGLLALPIHSTGWEDCINRFDRFYTDDREHVKHFPNDIYAELGEVLQGSAAGRTSRQQKIIAINIGIAIDDVAVANVLYQAAKRSNSGSLIDIDDYNGAFFL